MGVCGRFFCIGGRVLSLDDRGGRECELLLQGMETQLNDLDLWYLDIGANMNHV